METAGARRCGRPC